ncbi:MAG: hypothetical protein PHS47_04245 [Methanocellales archaeon]|nr:hypothetical protein [Methanocellales archaeon]
MFSSIQLKIMSQLAYNPLGIFSGLITFIAGWNATKNKFNLKQVFIIGIFCFVGIIWLIPFSVMPYLANMEFPQNYFLINLMILSLINGLITLIIYEIFALLGGWTSSKSSEKK